MNSKQAAVFLSSLIFSVGTFAASKWSGEWFEIEVILLSQLHDKTTQAEVFDEQTPLPQYQQSLDLLSRYLVPDIKTLKQQLPSCDAPHYPATLLEQASHLPALHPILSLSEISELTLNNESEITQFNSFEQTSNIKSNNQQGTTEPEDDFFDRVKPAYETSLDNNTANESATLQENELKYEQELPVTNEITEQQIALVAEAEQTFSPIKYNYHNLIEPAPNGLCIISELAFNKLNPDKNRYSYNGFIVDKMPHTINGVEDLFSEQPYLISEQSLQLKDIVKQLRRSKNFRPLLHLAWRQPVFDLSDATPIKLFAGDNLQAHFIKEQVKFLEQQQLAAQQEAELNKVLMAQTDSTSVELNQPRSLQQRLAQAKQQKLQTIFDNIKQVNDSEAVIEQLNQPIFTLDEILTQQSAMLTGPKTPIQPWYLQGFLNVYLKGVYLNIAADFNVLNLTLSEQSSLALKPNTQVKPQAIHFKQQRRMISQEVHYLDHPYMGMIVQIRRHQRPEHESENEEAQP